ncbi:nucleoside-diphosphate kinase [Fistulifera solaris]|uniref:Nucleoside diphosphate kinase n=1 Tax=Fistulifera solaris TaxID=1519565 RepID=A0A1Z5J739_FISSO|nr:nucleoside-diphosphate kinase [Fistulifera solaris]|eukprot:GAX09601.1 nucleoside-diphosphate kinase [Fistulifera solaris]
MFSRAASRLSTARSRITPNSIRSVSTVTARLAVPKVSLTMATGLVVATSTIGLAFTNCAETIPVYGVPGTNQERTFIACKPDAVQRGLVGAIIARFETRGYKLVGLKMVWPTKEMAETHYKDLSKKPFFPGLVEFFSSGPIVCMCWEGLDVIRQGRQMLGETQPLASKPGSIRGDYSIDLGRNICHGSDSPEGAEHELKMWFPEGVNDWAKTIDAWVYE